jgi:hypothetical protein
VSVVEALGPALGRLAASANRLWIEGQVVAARGISRAVQGLSQAMQHVKVGVEVMASATLTTAAAVVEGAVGRIRATLQDLRAGRERQAALSVRQNLAAVAAAAQTMAPGRTATAGKDLSEDEAMPADDTTSADETTVDAPRTPDEDPLVEQVNAARALVQDPEALSEPRNAQRVLEAVEEMVETAQERVAQEADSDAQSIASATGAAASAAPTPGPERQEMLPPAPPADLGRAVFGIGERLDQLAYRYYRDPALWRLLATVNDIDHPLRVRAGSMLRIPPVSALRASS